MAWLDQVDSGHNYWYVVICCNSWVVGLNSKTALKSTEVDGFSRSASLRKERASETTPPAGRLGGPQKASQDRGSTHPVSAEKTAKSATGWSVTRFPGWFVFKAAGRNHRFQSCTATGRFLHRHMQLQWCVADRKHCSFSVGR